MNGVELYQRLWRTTDAIARHRNYPGKEDLVHQHIDDLGRRFRTGELSFVQWSTLMTALLRLPEGREVRIGPLPPAGAAA
jgi:hypothetical protein